MKKIVILIAVLAAYCVFGDEVPEVPMPPDGIGGVGSRTAMIVAGMLSVAGAWCLYTVMRHRRG